ncbi:beta-galactosidase-like [Ylistrum balloti]|uniref:beta-galactosidase-like n=1 Tax=Ylistrum balloti TaxID=509963 RepID=UPI002905D06B|nr:beta-galactosidase-like [Ylistrum balloti]
MAAVSNALVVLIVTIISFSVLIFKVDGANFTIDYDKNTFLKDGKPFRYVSGSIHYSRIPQYYWKDRLLKMYAAGLNAIQLYVPWNIHQPEKDVYDFTGQQDLVAFLQTAQDVGLLVVMRAGPYICGEWDFGGIPAWILKEDPKTIFRTMDSTYIKYVDQWMDVLLPKLKPLLYNNGGPVIMVQIENEYGSYFACDRNYTTHLRDRARFHLGKDVVLFTTDGNSDGFLKCGYIPEVYATVDFGVSYNPAGSFKAQRDYEAKGPLVNSEFYTGWLDHWGQKHSVTDTNKVTTSLDLLLAYGANINMYMFEGGTNFGFWNGANYAPFQPVPTSYDYDAPLTEAGDITDKYLELRQIISKYLPLPDMPIPSSTPKAKYGQVQMTFVSTLQDAISQLCPKGPTKSQYPVTMESIGQYQGFALYRYVLKKNVVSQKLAVPGIRDRGYVMVDKVPQGVIVREKSTSLNITGKQGAVLDILVENQGHINYGSGINNNTKGIIQNVTLEGQILEDWMVYSLSLDNLNPSDIPLGDSPKSGAGLMTPSIYKGKLTISGNAEDTYLDMTGWTKGQALLQGQINLGRYWPKEGPQVRLFVPKPYLKSAPDNNMLLMFEIEGAPCQTLATCMVDFVDQPLINGTNSGFFSGQQEIGEGYFWHKEH